MKISNKSLQELKQDVFAANLLLPKYKLITFTWGNVSAIDKDSGLVAIKPSGVEYDTMTVDDIVILDLDGNKIDGRLNPSTDTDTHLALYRRYPDIGGIVHTHSRWATIFAQAKAGIPALGTTHADYFYGEIPCTREMTSREISGEYELETGNVIIETMGERGIDPMDIPAILVASHGPFTWGSSAKDAVHNAVVLEEVAMMAWHSMQMSGVHAKPMQGKLLDKHFLRKHGKGAYYGQVK
ncbi:MAG: L-ribulose-5-phosphate 4-epimerase [Clostridiales bacterium]|nr:L-ribulose-5-phosphate 4-epimerase [Clostridiales bacterium]